MYSVQNMTLPRGNYLGPRSDTEHRLEGKHHKAVMQVMPFLLTGISGAEELCKLTAEYVQRSGGPVALRQLHPCCCNNCTPRLWLFAQVY